MAPITRRALRSNTSLADANNAPTTNGAPLISEISTNARPVLGEVAGNSEASTAADGLTAQAQQEPGKISTTKGTGARKGKRKATGKASSKVETAQEKTGSTEAVLPEEEDEPRQEERIMGDSEAADKVPEAVPDEERQKGAVSMRDITVLTILC